VARTIITMSKDGTYTFSGEKSGAVLACFTALSAFRMVRYPLLAMLAGGVGAALHFAPF
jgi:hypothetical protein